MKTVKHSVQQNRLSVKDAATLMGADQQFIRIAMQRGHLPIGMAIKKSSQYTYYISKQKFAEYTGIPVNEIDAYLCAGPGNGETRKEDKQTRHEAQQPSPPSGVGT